MRKLAAFVALLLVYLPATAETAIPDGVGLKAEIGMNRRINVAMGRLIVNNKSHYIIKDIDVSCHWFGQSGTRIGSFNHTLFVAVAPGKIHRTREINFGFAPQQAEIIFLRDNQLA